MFIEKYKLFLKIEKIQYFLIKFRLFISSFIIFYEFFRNFRHMKFR